MHAPACGVTARSIALRTARFIALLTARFIALLTGTGYRVRESVIESDIVSD
jgi:hypothetical protein